MMQQEQHQEQEQHQAEEDAEQKRAQSLLLALVRSLPRLPQPLQQAVACRLLCCSQATCAAMQLHCSGGLALRVAVYHLDVLKGHVVPWLRRNGCLLRSLRLQLSMESDSSIAEADALIGAALQAAGSSVGSCGTGAGSGWAPAPGLQLCSFASHPAVAGAVLNQLDSYYLTSLDLGRHAAYSAGFILEGLTKLERLSLLEDSADALLPSLGSLTRLSHLSLTDIAASSVAKLRFLPPQLLELQLSLARVRRCEAPPPLALGHLAAATSLTNGDGKPLLVQAGDALPPALRRLRVRDVVDAGPLLALRDLRELSMSASATPAAGLAAVGAACSSLSAVSLCYGDMAAAASAAPSWPALPLASLTLRAAEGQLPAATLQHLACCSTRLQRLDIYGGHGSSCFAAAATLQASLEELAGVLRQLHGLRALSLRGIGVSASGTGAAAASHQLAACKLEGEGGEDAKQLAGQMQQCVRITFTAVDSSSSLSGSAGQASCSYGSSLLSCSYGDSSHSSPSRGSGACLAAGPAAATAAVLEEEADEAVPSLQPLLDAVASLSELRCVSLSSITVGAAGGQPAVLDVPAARTLAAGACSRQLTSLQLSDVGATDAAVEALFGDRGGSCEEGLASRLRRLVLDANPNLTSALLPDELAAQLTALSELGVMRTGIRGDALAFKARMLRSRPGLHVRSSAR